MSVPSKIDRTDPHPFRYSDDPQARRFKVAWLPACPADCPTCKKVAQKPE